MKTILLALAAPLAMLAGTGSALAQANNNAPPAGAVFSLTGQAQSTTFQQYGFSFVAQYATTNLTFALRNDPNYLQLDDISLSTLGGTNLLVNGDFEAGADAGNSAVPIGWSYLNQYGASAGGVVQTGSGRNGSIGYYDGAVQAYDAITQAVNTQVGTTYTVSFWAAVNSVGGTGLYQPLSTNGDTTTSGGDGIDLFAYVGEGAPPPAGAETAVPEPASWAMMTVGFGAVGGTLRRRKARTTVRFA